VNYVSDLNENCDTNDVVVSFPWRHLLSRIQSSVDRICKSTLSAVCFGSRVKTHDSMSTERERQTQNVFNP